MILPPDISSTRVTYSRAKSIQMSEAGQDVCIFITSGAWARTAGAARTDPAAAPPAKAPVRRNERREYAAFFSKAVMSFLPVGRALPSAAWKVLPTTGLISTFSGASCRFG
ncbi:hypothetical protein RSP03_34620 [Cereibacter sphaeroides]|nr:hypothetical protein RSP03_34620 [Cereibacter sphaeroides]